MDHPTPKVPFPIDKHQWQPGLLPGPIALISTADEQGTPNVAPKSWLQMVSFEPPMLMFSGQPNGTTERNIIATECFAVNVVDSRLASKTFSCIRFKGTERIARSEFRLTSATAIDAPLVENCKAHLECRLSETKPMGASLVVFGEIVAAAIDQDVLAAEPRTRYAILDQTLFLEDGLFAQVRRPHPAQPEKLSAHTTRWVVLLTPVRPELFTEDLVRQHVQHLERLEAQGLLELCGPFADESGGMVVLNVADETQARDIAEQDPFIRSGAESYVLREWELSCRDNHHLGVTAPR